MTNWYIVQTYSGFEKKVASIIDENKKKNKLDDKIEEVFIPTHEVTEIRKGKRIQAKKKYFPGYILVKMDMNKELYHMIKDIKNVTGFLGQTGKPSPVSDNEVDKIMSQIKDGVVQPAVGRSYEIGEKVKVIDGPFASFTGSVEEVEDEKHRLKVSVLIFGRATPVELEYTQVEKL